MTHCVEDSPEVASPRHSAAEGSPPSLDSYIRHSAFGNWSGDGDDEQDLHLQILLAACGAVAAEEHGEEFDEVFETLFTTGDILKAAFGSTLETPEPSVTTPVAGAASDNYHTTPRPWDDSPQVSHLTPSSSLESLATNVFLAGSPQLSESNAFPDGFSSSVLATKDATHSTQSEAPEVHKERHESTSTRKPQRTQPSNSSTKRAASAMDENRTPKRKRRPDATYKLPPKAPGLKTPILGRPKWDAISGWIGSPLQNVGNRAENRVTKAEEPF